MTEGTVRQCSGFVVEGLCLIGLVSEFCAEMFHKCSVQTVHAVEVS
jgi:hypothetical protein